MAKKPNTVSVYMSCEASDCFANKDGRCTILTAKTRRQPCPFFKTVDQFVADAERAAKINGYKAEQTKSDILDMLSISPNSRSERHKNHNTKGG